MSTLSATRFTPYIPQSNTLLPLNASIVSTHASLAGSRLAPTLEPVVGAHAGSWLSFTVVLTNTSKRAFPFGRTCPAYTESVGSAREQAYVLNCHGACPIPPHQSVRFAMRVHVPAKLGDPGEGLWWTLAPHSIDPPQAYADIALH